MRLWSVEKYSNGKWRFIASGLLKSEAELVRKNTPIDIMKNESVRMSTTLKVS